MFCRLPKQALSTLLTITIYWGAVMNKEHQQYQIHQTEDTVKNALSYLSDDDMELEIGFDNVKETIKKSHKHQSH